MCCCYLCRMVWYPSTFVHWLRAPQPKHVSNPDSFTHAHRAYCCGRQQCLRPQAERPLRLSSSWNKEVHTAFSFAGMQFDLVGKVETIAEWGPPLVKRIGGSERV